MHHPDLPAHRRTRTRTRRPLAFVVRDPTPDEVDAPVDWSSWHLTDEDDMGQSNEQGKILRTAASALEQLAEERGWTRVYIGTDNFFAWVQADPLVRVSPDLYLLDDPPAPPLPKSWQTWLPGHRPPRFAVEVVSDDWKKDYEENPLKYAQLGTRELVIFDPDAALNRKLRGRVPLQVYRRGEDGAFVRVYVGAGPAWSEELGAFVVIRREGPVARLRIARDADGVDLVPTAEEAKRAAEEKLSKAEARIRELEQALKNRGGV